MKRIDRRRQRAEVLLANATGSVYVPYEDQKRPPPPLSTVLLEQTASGQWRLASTNPRGQVLHDDFTVVVVSGTTFGADTYWNAAGSGNVWQSSDIEAEGLLAMTVDNVAASYVNASKTDLAFSVRDEVGLWFSAAIGLDDLTQGDLQAGLSNDAGTILANVFYSHAFGLLGQARRSGTTTITIGQPTPSIYTLYPVDVVLVGGQYVAVWWDGDGPYVIRSHVPAVGDGLQPYLYIGSGDGISTPTGYFDWVHVETFGNVTPPERLTDILADQTV